MSAFDAFKALVEIFDPGRRWAGQKQTDIEQVERTPEYGAAEPSFGARSYKLLCEGGFARARLASYPHGVDAGGCEDCVQFHEFDIKADEASE